MTFADTRTRTALATLKPPLIFGDPNQIAAVDWLSLLEEQLENCKRALAVCPHLKVCPDCDGDGEFYHGDYAYECLKCDGSGDVKDVCGCAKGFDPLILRIARASA